MLLMIDNFDSFTHNLARYFCELDCDVEVVRNNAIDVGRIEQLNPDYLVLSPGPCTPDQAGISLSVVRELAGKIPILGICLGHQTIGQAFGTPVIRARTVRHGKVSTVHHSEHPLFNGVPSSFNATRYHSLVLDPTAMSAEFETIAWCNEPDGYQEIMAIAHKTLPLWGIQYHPESLLTEHGHTMLANFLTLGVKTPTK